MAGAVNAGFLGRGARLALAACVALCVLSTGCTSEEDRLEAISATASSNPAAATAELVQQYRDGRVHHDTAISFATGRLQDGKDETAFGGVVLAFMDEVQGDFKKDSEYELFWMGIGRLAFWSAHVAYAHGRTEEALSLVFAGPKRWQAESYWLMYPDHDALASYILDSAGRHGEAVTRLRNRSEVFGEAEAALEALTRGAR